MIIHKFIKTIASRITADGNIRPSLAWVHITPTHFEATNSFMAVRIKNLFTEKDNTNYPSTLKRVIDKWITISKEQIKMIPFKKSKWSHLSDRATIVSSGDSWEVSVECTYATNEKVRVTWNVINGNFPNIESFINDKDWYNKCWVNAQYMIDVLTVMIDAGYKDVALLTNWLKPIFIEPAYKVEWDDSTGLIMPIKL